MRENSTYNKIHEIIRRASGHNWSLGRLAESITKNTDAFFYYKRDKDGVVKEFVCDPSTIRRKIRFCIRLGLLDNEDSCVLTPDGKNAISRGIKRFDLQLQLAVINYLANNDVGMKKIETAIEKLMFPDTDALYQYIAPNLQADLFRTCLFLLSECGKDSRQNLLKPYDKKLYLTENKLKKAKKQLER